MTTEERDSKRRKIVPDEKEKVLESSREVIHPFPDTTQYIFKKRTAERPTAKENEIYVSRKSNHFALLKRGRKIFTMKNEVIIHGLGSSIPLAVDLSLMIRHDVEKMKGIKVETFIKTNTVELVDDFIPKNGESKIFSQVRKNSAIHIRLAVKKE